LRRVTAVDDGYAGVRRGDDAASEDSVHRLMQALVEANFVTRDEENMAYTPTIKLWELGSAVLGNLDLRRYAEPHMEALMALTGESVHLSVLDRRDVVYVHKVDSDNPVRAYTQIGTSNTIISPEEFLKVMQEIRIAGYAINRAEWREGVWGVAAPIFDSRGMVIAGIGISGPAERFLSAILSKWCDAVIAAASNTSEALRT